MNNPDTALPAADTSAEAGGQPNAELLEQNAEQIAGEEGQQEAEKKPEKTPEQRERERMQRGIDRKTRQAAEARAEAAALRRELDHLRGSAPAQNNASDDSEPVSLSRAELAEMVKREAEKLAPTLKQETAEIERRRGVVESLSKTLGQERFDALAESLDEAIGGLADRSGKPKPATDAIFEADDPKAVIEYLADEDNADEAEAIGRMSPVQAGRAIAKLEQKLGALKAQDKPKPSKAAPPIEPLRGQGGVKAEPDTSKWTDAQWAAHRRSQRK